MMKYITNVLGIKERTAIEVAKMDIAAQVTTNEIFKSQVDYIAMMTDVELPVIESEVSYEPEI